MGLTIREGLNKHGIPAGKRDLRDSKASMESRMFKEPLILLQELVKLILLCIYVPIENIILYFTAKPKSLRGKVCFVTGSGRGIGRAICIALAKEGAIVACADIHEENNSKTVEILTEMGAKAKAYKLNVANKSEVEALAKKVEAELGAVYLLVNNAAIVMPSPTHDEGYVRAAFGVNVLGAIWTIGAFLPKMKELNEGHIVNISSMSSAIGGPIINVYAATKAALSSYSLSVRVELAFEGYQNIFVTTVHPWVVNSSADYVDASNSRIMATEVGDLIELIMKSIKYNKEEVATHTFLYILTTFTRFLPCKLIKAIFELGDVKAILPTIKEYKDLSVSDIVRKTNCSDVGTGPKSSET